MGLKHPALLKSSHWKYSERLRDILAAKWWGCPSVSYFDQLSREERINIIAAYEVQWRMDAVNNYEMAQEAERKARQAANKAKGKR